MGNIFKTQEQRDRWNKYNSDYSKRNYRTITLKLNKKTDKRVIDYLDSTGESTTTVVRRFLRGIIEKTQVESQEIKSDNITPQIYTWPSYMSEKKQSNNIRRIRMQHGLTQTELAKALGVTKQGICFNETGRASRKLSEAVADYFKVSVLEVMGMDAFEYMPKNEEEKQYLISLLNQLKF